MKTTLGMNSIEFTEIEGTLEPFDILNVTKGQSLAITTRGGTERASLTFYDVEGTWSADPIAVFYVGDFADGNTFKCSLDQIVSIALMRKIGA